jgi:hypothetical protein
MNLLVKTCNYDRMNAQRWFARGFVVLGGVFWVSMIFGAKVGYQGVSVPQGLVAVLVPLLITIAVFVLGMYYETLTAVILFVVAAASLVFAGFSQSLNVGSWAFWVMLMVLPAGIAGVLYLLAAQTQMVCELDEQGGGGQPHPAA